MAEPLGGRSEFLIREYLKARKAYTSLQKALLGEGAIWHELCKLPDGYVFIQDIISFNPGNIDFVVAGPTGIYSIEVKYWEGRIGLNGLDLMQNGESRGRGALLQALNNARRVERTLEIKLGKKFEVSPILVFVKSKMFEIDVPTAMGVAILTKPKLVRYITTQPSKNLDVTEIKDVLSKFHIPAAPLQVKLVRFTGNIGGHVNLCKHIADLDIHEA